MKFKFITIIASIACLFVACGSSQKDSEGKEMSSKEDKALEYIKTHLKKDYELKSYSFVEGQWPIEMTIDLKRINSQLLDDVIKYHQLTIHPSARTSKYLEDFKNKVAHAENNILESVKVAESKRSEKTFLMALVTMKYDDGKEVDYFKQIIAFNPETLEKEYWEPLGSAPGNALLIVNAERGTLADYELSKKGYNIDSLANTVSDPVLKFILEPVK